MKITKSELKELIRESIEEELILRNEDNNFFALESEIDNFDKLLSLTENNYISEAIDINKIKEKLRSIGEKIVKMIKALIAKIGKVIKFLLDKISTIGKKDVDVEFKEFEMIFTGGENHIETKMVRNSTDLLSALHYNELKIVTFSKRIKALFDEDYDFEEFKMEEQMELFDLEVKFTGKRNSDKLINTDKLIDSLRKTVKIFEDCAASIDKQFDKLIKHNKDEEEYLNDMREVNFRFANHQIKTYSVLLSAVVSAIVIKFGSVEA
jgi:hypothetical protein